MQKEIDLKCEAEAGEFEANMGYTVKTPCQQMVKTKDIKATAIVLYFSNINNDLCPCAYTLISILSLESKNWKHLF